MRCFDFQQIGPWSFIALSQVNRVANDGSTPLSKAAMSGKNDVVRALCEAGADPNIQAGKKNWGATAGGDRDHAGIWR